MKYFWIATGLRGAYMPDNSYVVACKTRRELKETIAFEADSYADAGFVGASKKAVARLAAAAWKNAQAASPAHLPHVLPLAREKGSGYAFGIFASVATRADWKEAQEEAA